MMIFSPKFEKSKIFESLIHGDFNIFFQKKMENQDVLHVFGNHTYADLDIILHKSQENENILHFMEILTYRSMRCSSLLTAKKYFSKMTFRRL